MTILVAAGTTAYAYSTAGVGLAVAGLAGVITAGSGKLASQLGVEIASTIAIKQAKKDISPFERITGTVSEDTKAKILLKTGLTGCAFGLAGIFGGYAASDAILFDKAKENNDAAPTEVSSPTEVTASILDSYEINKNNQYVLTVQAPKIAA